MTPQMDVEYVAQWFRRNTDDTHALRGFAARCGVTALKCSARQLWAKEEQSFREIDVQTSADDR
jgi:hypothetical protein